VICTKCHRDLPGTAFYHGRQCRGCRNAYMRAWLRNNQAARERANTRSVEWHKQNKDRFNECARESRRLRAAADPAKEAARKRRVHLKHFYGITPEHYESMLAAQGGGCAICGSRKAPSKRQWLYVDHDHATGAVRGILCARCNMAIGCLEGQHGREMLKYLNRHGLRLAASDGVNHIADSLTKIGVEYADCNRRRQWVSQ